MFSGVCFKLSNRYAWGLLQFFYNVPFVGLRTHLHIFSLADLRQFTVCRERTVNTVMMFTLRKSRRFANSILTVIAPKVTVAYLCMVGILRFVRRLTFW